MSSLAYKYILHEAAHAVIAEYLGITIIAVIIECTKASILTDDTEIQLLKIKSRKEKLEIINKDICMSLSGFVAMSLLLPNTKEDIEMYTKDSSEDILYAEDSIKKYYINFKQIKDILVKKTYTLVQEKQHQIKRVADKLTLTHTVVNKERPLSIFNGTHLQFYVTKGIQVDMPQFLRS